MAIALLVGFSVLIALSLTASVLVYSHYIYSKNRVFSKTRYAILAIAVCAFMAAIFLVAGILFVLDYVGQEPMEYCLAFVVLSFVSLAISLVYLVIFLLIPRLTNKNKISYDMMLKVNYHEKVAQIEQQIGDIEVLKNKLSTKHTKYYHDMLTYYESILNRAKNSQISKVEKMADIVTFNDAFTHKWSTLTNNYQLLLTFKFCEIFENIS